MANIGYVLTVGCAAVAAVTMLGAWWKALKTGGAEQARAKRVARIAWWAATAFTIGLAAMALGARPEMAAVYASDPRHAVAATVAIAGLIGVRLWDRKETELLTFFASASYIVGMVLSAR